MVLLNKDNTNTTRYLRKTIIATALAISLGACGGGGSGDGGSGSGNNDSPPTVAAEARMLASAGNSVTLVANASDPDGDTISYSWTQVSGLPISNTSGFNTASASFSAPDKVDALVLQVTATANGRSDTAQVQVLVLEQSDIAIFVDSEFSGTSTGEIDAPFTDLASVLNNLNPGEDVYIKTPANDERLSVQITPGEFITLRSGNSIYGGFREDWSRDIEGNRTGLMGLETGLIYRTVDLPTVVSGVDILVETSQIDDAFNAIGLYADHGSSPFIVDNSSITIEDFFDNKVDSTEGSSYGIYFLNMDTTEISNSNITAGNASSSAGMAPRTSGEGRDGADGEDAREGLNINGGTGGATQGGGWNGGAGGNAGNTSFEPGENGTRGGGRTEPVLVRGGNPGSGGFDSDTSTSGGRDGVPGGIGDDGPRGPAGEGASGNGAFASSSGAFVRSTGSNGGNGWAGGGGGGGGGAAAGAAGANGGAGGGGGEGGDGGEGGNGARSGFASIGIHIAGGNTHVISNNRIESGNGGRGGIGGTGADGGDGGTGGDGVNGTQGPANAKGGFGGHGGDGGKGGRGGSGGSGGGGPSFGIFIGSSTPATITSNVITTGNGGQGASADFTNELVGAGFGGWTIGIFDANINDNLSVDASANTVTLGEAGQDGNPREGIGQRSNTNFD